MSAKWQRRHYEPIAAGLKAKGAPSSEIDEWIRKFAADNPRFRADYFRAAAQGGTVSIQTRQRGGRTITREYRPVSRPKRAFKVPTLGFGSHGKSRCKYGKKRNRGRWVCRKSPRRK